MSNTKPDFSRDPERVQLAEAMLNATRASRGLAPCKLGALAAMDQEQYLIEADAAITHLGSGHRLPEATEANAERWAREHCKLNLEQDWYPMRDDQRAKLCYQAKLWLIALHAAFADAAEKPEPVFLREDQMRPVELDPVSVEGEFVTRSLAQFEQAALVELADQQIRGANSSLIGVLCDAVRLVREHRRTAIGNEDYVRRCPVALDGKRCNLAVHADDIGHDNGETSWLEAQPLRKTQQFEPRKMDATERGERRRERQEKVWQAACALWPHWNGGDIIASAAVLADRWITWRDCNDEKAMEAYRK